MTSLNFQPLILQPSRVTLRSQTLIDNIFTNDIQHSIISGNLTCTISDHFAQFAIMTDYRLSSKKSDERPIYGRSYTYFSDQEFIEELSNIEWPKLFANETNPNALTKILLDQIIGILDTMAPYRRLTKKEISLQRNHGYPTPFSKQ